MALLLTAALFLFGFLHTHSSLDCIVVIAFGTIDQPFGAQNLGFAPRPKQLLGGHTVVFKEAAESEGCGAENTNPACALGTGHGAEDKVQCDSYCNGKNRTDKLPEREPEEYGLPVFLYFLWYLYFYASSSPLRKNNRLYLS